MRYETESMSWMKLLELVWDNYRMPDLVSLVALKVLKATEQLWHWVLWFKFLKRKPSHSRKSQPPLATAKKSLSLN